MKGEHDMRSTVVEPIDGATHLQYLAFPFPLRSYPFPFFFIPFCVKVSGKASLAKLFLFPLLKLYQNLNVF